MADTKISLLDTTNTNALKDKVWAARYELLVYLNANQSLTTSTNVDISWTTAETDTGSIFSAGTFVTVPTGMTKVRGSLLGYVAGSTNTGSRYLWIDERTSGNVFVKQLARMSMAGGDNFLSAPMVGWRPVTAGNRIYAAGHQTSGGTGSFRGAALTDSGGPPTMMWLEFRP